MFQVQHKIDKKSYAVKITQYTDDKALREIDSLSTLSHRNVVRYINSWVDEYEDEDQEENWDFSSSEVCLMPGRK